MKIKTYRIFYKVVFSVLILLSISCSSITENETQVSDIESVKPLPSVNQKSEITWTQEEAKPFQESEIDKMTDEDIFQNRSMSLYEKRSTSRCNSYKCKEKILRGFIWNHWSKQKRGFVKDSIQGIDLKVTNYIFIEPDEHGKWFVVWKTVANHSMNEYDEITESVGTISIDRSKANNWKFLYKNNEEQIIKEL